MTVVNEVISVLMSRFSLSDYNLKYEMSIVRSCSKTLMSSKKELGLFGGAQPGASSFQVSNKQQQHLHALRRVFAELHSHLTRHAFFKAFR